MIEAPTQALRARSPELLRDALLHMLAAYQGQAVADIRDFIWGLAPYHDCATRLGLDPAAFFSQVAEAGPPELRETVREFGGRADTSPDAFGGYALLETADGPCYVWR